MAEEKEKDDQSGTGWMYNPNAGADKVQMLLKSSMLVRYRADKVRVTYNMCVNKNQVHCSDSLSKHDEIVHSRIRHVDM